METPGSVPRVSQYRLAAHLGTAFVLYAGMLGTGLAALRDWKFSVGGRWSGRKGDSWERTLQNPRVKAFSRGAWALTGLVFITALSGIGSLCSFVFVLMSDQVLLSLGWTLVWFSMSFHLWEVVWHLHAMNCFLLRMARHPTGLTLGGEIC